VPSRSSFLTGRYVHSHKVWSNRFELHDREINLGRVFQDAGYHTALVGTNHIFRDPRFHGFETFHYHEWPWGDLIDEHKHHGF
jgi:arylsulfatase A-like enzyme